MHKNRVSNPVQVEPLESWDLDFNDIEFLQENLRVRANKINGDIPLVLRIAYDLVPEHLKAISVTLTHPEDVSRSFSFLLKINKDKTFYEAKVAPFANEGRYPLKLTVYDYQTKELFTVTGALDVQKRTQDTNIFGIPLTIHTESASPTGLILWLLLLILIVYFLYRVSKMDVLMERNFTALRRVRSAVLLFGFAVLVGVFWLLLQSVLYFLITGEVNKPLLAFTTDDAVLPRVIVTAAVVFILLSLFFVKRKK